MPRLHAAKRDPLDLKGTHSQRCEIPHQHILPSAKTTATKHYSFVKFLARTLEESRNSKRTFQRFREAGHVQLACFDVILSERFAASARQCPARTLHSLKSRGVLYRRDRLPHPRLVEAGSLSLGVSHLSLARPVNSPGMRLSLRRLRRLALRLLPHHLRLHAFRVRCTRAHEWTSPGHGDRERQCAQCQAGSNVALERFERLHGGKISIKRLYLYRYRLRWQLARSGLPRILDGRCEFIRPSTSPRPHLYRRAPATQGSAAVPH
jgi:hypothetical protein